MAVERRLSSPDFVQDPHEATAEHGERILDVQRRLVAADALHYPGDRDAGVIAPVHHAVITLPESAFWPGSDVLRIRVEQQEEMPERHDVGGGHTVGAILLRTVMPHADLMLGVEPGGGHIEAVAREARSSGGDVERMHQAWMKACLLQLSLWSHPDVKDGDF